jgi:predicted dehydrogenase
MERRNFIKHSGLIGGGLLVPDYLTGLLSDNGAGGKLNIGLIGCGDRGKGILHIMKTLPEQFNIVAVCDNLDFRLAQVDIGGIKKYSDYRKLLDNKQIQAVIIATPLNLHYPMTVDALEAGKHVYLEKTMTYSIPEALELVQKSKKYLNQTLQIGHQYRYTPLYFQVKEMIDKGYLGKVTQIDCHWDRNASWRRPVPSGLSDRQINWRMYREYSGGLPAELLSHQIDFINWAFNTHPDEVLGTGGVDFYKDGRETYDNVSAVLRYEKANMIGNFGATCANSREGYVFKIKGSKGTISLLVNNGLFYPEPETKKELSIVDGVTGATKIEWSKDGGIPILNEKLKDGTYYALVDFHKAITEKTQPASNVHTGATTAISVHMANNAIYNHTIERWKDNYTV